MDYLQTTFMLTLCSCLTSCGLKKEAVTKPNRPAIYDAWDARYTYQIQDRKMIPVYEGKMIGRSWGRDSSGKINHVSYLGADREREENLLSFHQNQTDRKREKKWEKSKEDRIKFVKSQLELQEAEESAPLIEVKIEEEEEDFLPPMIMPEGIDLSAPNPTPEKAPDEGGALPLPFLPL